MLLYLPLLPIFFLLLTAGVMLIIRLWRPGFAYFWLVAVFGALLAWPAVLILRQNMPLALPLVAWRPEGLFSSSPALLVDRISWPYALALVTLALAVILTEVARAAEAEWTAWAGDLALAALGLLAVLAGNPLTLLLAWAAIDLAELLVLLNHLDQSRERERAVIAFSTRVAGIMLFLGGAIMTRAEGSSLTFDHIPRTASVLLLLASGFRLGVVPLHLPLLHEIHLRRGLGTMIRLVTAAASLVLLARTANAGVPENISPFLLALSSLAAVYAGVSWLFARDELDGRPFWMLGLASLSLSAAVRSQPAASQSWGVSLLLAGGLLFLFSARHSYLLVLLLFGFLSLSALPFTPTWSGGQLFAPPLNLWLVLLLVAQVLFMMGYLRHALRPGPGLAGVERWVLAIYPFGLFLLPMVHFLIGWWDPAEAGPFTLDRLVPGLLSLALVAVGIYLWQHTPDLPSGLSATLRRYFSLQWLYRLLVEFYRGLGRLIGFLSAILEGEGGVLWALLFLTLLIAFIIQGSLGG